MWHEPVIEQIDAHAKHIQELTPHGYVLGPGLSALLCGFGRGARMRLLRLIEDKARRSLDTSDAMRWSSKTLWVLAIAAWVSSTTTLCTQRPVSGVSDCKQCLEARFQCIMACQIGIPEGMHLQVPEDITSQ